MQRLASVRFGWEWLNWNSLSLLCFDAATLNRKSPFIYPERFISTEAWPSKGDSRQINVIYCMWALPWAISCKPSAMRWGSLKAGAGISSKHFCLFWKHWLTAPYSRSCVNIWVVCKCGSVCGREGKEDAALSQAAAARSIKWPIFYSECKYTSQPTFMHKLVHCINQRLT